MNPDNSPSCVRSALSSSGPTLRGVNQNARPPKVSKKYRALNSHHVTHWDDFILANLSSAYGDILDRPLPPQVETPASTTTVWNVNNASELKNMTVEHLEPFLRGPVKQGADALGARMRRHIPDITMARDAHFTKPTSPCCPALAFRLDGPRQDWLAPGVVRMNSAWNSSHLAQAQQSERAGAPLRQLSEYAKKCNSSYAFSITEEEVVVVQFFLLDGKRPGMPESLGAPWAAFSWQQSGEGVMTAKMAIWGIIMMALNERTRELRPKGMIRPLNAWKPYREQGLVVRYQHFYSLMKCDTVPEGGITME